MIKAAAKAFNDPRYTQKYIPMMPEIIKSVFKIAAINGKKNYYYYDQ